MACRYQGTGPGPIGLRANAQRLFALRGNLPFDLSHDQALVPMPAEAQADIERIIALWAECRAVASERGPYLFGRLSVADAFSRRWLCAFALIAWSCQQKIKRISTPFINGLRSKPGNRPD